MLTLIVSDLHLGSPSRADALREPRVRALLFDAAREADRLVLLGDLLELREGAASDVIDAARPLFEGLGRVLAGRELAIVPGNHDHALAAPWLARRRDLGRDGLLGLEQKVPLDASPMLALLAQWVKPVSPTVCYPGLWVREDVYATHGHYLDCHMGIAGGERLMLAANRHAPGRGRRRLASVEDYEAVTGPVYARLDSSARLRRLAGSHWLARLGRLLGGLSHEQLVRAERAAMGEVAATLGLAEAYVVFAHTHRPGPFPGDPCSQWRGRLGARLVNCGCWLENDMHDSPTGGPNDDSPTGGDDRLAHRRTNRLAAPCVLVGESGPPVPIWLDGSLRIATQRSPGAHQ